MSAARWLKPCARGSHGSRHHFAPGPRNAVFGTTSRCRESIGFSGRHDAGPVARIAASIGTSPAANTYTYASCVGLRAAPCRCARKRFDSAMLAARFAATPTGSHGASGGIAQLTLRTDVPDGTSECRAQLRLSRAVARGAQRCAVASRARHGATASHASAARPSSNSLSRALRVNSAARRNSTFASSARPSFASRSPRTLGSQ